MHAVGLHCLLGPAKMMRFALLLLALELAAADTSALDAIEFYPSSGPLLATESWGPAVIAVASLNDGLWAAANTTLAETPFSKPPHPRGIETVLNG